MVTALSRKVFRYQEQVLLTTVKIDDLIKNVGDKVIATTSLTNTGNDKQQNENSVQTLIEELLLVLLDFHP